MRGHEDDHHHGDQLDRGVRHERRSSEMRGRRSRQLASPAIASAASSTARVSPRRMARSLRKARTGEHLLALVGRRKGPGASVWRQAAARTGGRRLCRHEGETPDVRRPERQVGVDHGCEQRDRRGGARGFGRCGARVGVHYHKSREAAEEVAAEVRAAGGAAVVLQGDVTQKADLARIIDGQIRAFGRLEVLINNAGDVVGLTPVRRAHRRADRPDHRAQRPLGGHRLPARRCLISGARGRATSSTPHRSPPVRRAGRARRSTRPPSRSPRA